MTVAAVSCQLENHQFGEVLYIFLMLIPKRRHLYKICWCIPVLRIGPVQGDQE